jgi:hypothetical protein
MGSTASWPGLSRPSTWFGAANARKRAIEAEKICNCKPLPQAAPMSDRSLQRQGVDDRDKPGHDGKAQGAIAENADQQLTL